MKQPKILITDDERNIRLMFRTTLAQEGYVVGEASNGQEALDEIELSSPDVVILDLNMPVLDGMAVLEHLRSKNGLTRKPKVIVLTAYGSIPAAVKAIRLGAVDFIEKPVTPDELRETIKGVLAEASREPRPQPTERDLAGGYEAVLERVRRALRAEDVETAESLLMRAADVSGGRDAPYFNLLGVLYEVQRNWRLAKKFYGKAMRANRKYEPAQQNMKRMYELETFGATKVPITLGDEPEPSVLEQFLRDRHSAPGH
jgi:DNA-binding response OmpR family regulator